MFGFACSETDELMPLPIMLAHKLARGLSSARRDGVARLSPSGRQVAGDVEYDGTTPVRVDAVVVSSQHSPLVTQETMRDDITEKIINAVDPAPMIGQEHQDLRQPDRPLRRRRTARRRRRHRPQDHRRHLRRRRAARRRRVLGQGSDQGRSLGLLHGPLHREERRRRGTGRPRAGAARLRDRRRRSGVGDGRHRRHRADRGRADHRAGARALQADAARHHARSSTCAGRSTRRPRRSATSAAPSRSSPGSGPTRLRRCKSAGKLQSTVKSDRRVKRVLLITAALVAAVAILHRLSPSRPQPLPLDTSWRDGTDPRRDPRPQQPIRRPQLARRHRRVAARAGLKFIVFTDHGDATRTPDPPAYRSGVLCIDARRDQHQRRTLRRHRHAAGAVSAGRRATRRRRGRPPARLDSGSRRIPIRRKPSCGGAGGRPDRRRRADQSRYELAGARRTARMAGETPPGAGSLRHIRFAMRRRSPAC